MIREACPVLAPQRRERIRTLVREGVARVEDLRKTLKVSVATIRGDLEVLEEQGKVRRVHGGAVSTESRLEESVFDDKTTQSSKEKLRIAEEAYRMIEREESIFIDGGSTTLFLARMLCDRNDLTVVTNSLRAALELAEKGPRVILTGGELAGDQPNYGRPADQSCTGSSSGGQSLYGDDGLLPDQRIDHHGSQRSLRQEPGCRTRQSGDFAGGLVQSRESVLCQGFGLGQGRLPGIG